MITNYNAETMNADDAKAFMERAKGTDIVVTLTDGTDVSGVAISVNSKGVNVTVDGKVKSISLKRVAVMTPDAGQFNDFLVDDDRAIDELSEGEIVDLIDAGEIDDPFFDEDLDVECDHANTTPVTRPVVGGPAAMCDDCGNGVGIHHVPAPADDADDADDVETFTTAEVAAMLEMTAKDLRVQLRAMSMGVGQGRRYGLTSDDVAVIRAALAPAS